MDLSYMYRNKFFILGKKKLTKKQLENYCLVWWPIQPEFTLGLIKLLGNIASEMNLALQFADLKKEKGLKSLFSFQAPGIIDEMGYGRDPYGLMHHDLFLRQVMNTTKLTKTKIVSNPIKTEGNIQLAYAIRESFRDICPGLCMMYVVETLAPRIFETQKRIFISAGAPSKKLLHSNLHVKLEKEHADEAKKMLAYMNKYFNKKEVSEHIGTFSRYWEKFLDNVFEVVTK